jgi:GH3 auxin-responsive promoter
MICTLANSLWFAGCVSEHARFLLATRRVADEQELIFRRILSENADTEFGRSLGFSSIRSIAEYQERVPLQDYDQHEAWISRAALGVPNVLTRERVRLFEPTSGSSGATKLIPYTASLQREFQRAIRAWIADLFTHDSRLLATQAYWSVSPVRGERKTTSGGISIGFDDDTSYVGGWQQRLVNRVMAVPREVRLTSDIDAFRYKTLLFLLRSRTLGLISVWNPTYLSILLEQLPAWGDRLAYDLARGTLCPPDVLRSLELREALRANTPRERSARLWPKLRLISCWADANAAAPAARLAELFPHSRIQGKGLIATEAFVSFPLVGQECAALAIRSHFLEFLPAGSDRPLLAHQLERGGQYTVVVTTGGGLYRYQLGDRIEVMGHLRGCPLSRFIGRQSYVSDWFGEKLCDAHVTQVFEETFRTLAMTPAFAMLACSTDAPPGYVLYIDSPERRELIERAAELIDTRLRGNFHYNYARQLGQLACVRAVRVRDGAGAYLAAAIRNGQKVGDVKAPALDRYDGWSKIFAAITPDKCQGSAPHTSS